MEDTRTAAKALLGLRKKVQKTCPVCGTAFEGYKQRKYCSVKCRVAAHRMRMREKEERESFVPVVILPMKESELLSQIASSFLSGALVEVCSKCGRECEGKPITTILAFSCNCGEIWTRVINLEEKKKEQKESEFLLISTTDLMTSEPKRVDILKLVIDLLTTKSRSELKIARLPLRSKD